MLLLNRSWGTEANAFLSIHHRSYASGVRVASTLADFLINQFRFRILKMEQLQARTH